MAGLVVEPFEAGRSTYLTAVEYFQIELALAANTMTC
jgi:hypothetical protein